MSRRGRLVLFAAAAAGLAALLGWGLAGLPAVGEFHGAYGRLLGRVAVGERHATDIVASVVFDYRGFDTLIEEFILFTAGLGLTVLLRQQRREHRRGVSEAQAAESRIQDTSDVLAVVGLGLVGPTVLLGVYVVTHGHLTPGGGFQGGVILASALALVYLAGSYLAMRRIGPIPLLEAGESVGAAGFALIGAGGLLLSTAFLANFLPLGVPKMLLSGGTIPLLNVSVGLEVAGVFALAFAEFLDQAVLVRRG